MIIPLKELFLNHSFLLYTHFLHDILEVLKLQRNAASAGGHLSKHRLLPTLLNLTDRIMMNGFKVVEALYNNKKECGIEAGFLYHTDIFNTILV
jgi:hypothetical protein